MAETETELDPAAVEEMCTWLSATTDKRFRLIVDDEMRQQIDRTDVTKVAEDRQLVWRLRAAALRTPELLERWHHTLVAMRISVENQLEAKAAEIELVKTLKGKSGEVSTYNHWRATALRFKGGLEEKIFEVERLIRMSGGMEFERMEEERNRAIARAVTLENAIRQHHDAFPSDDEPSADDKELWKHVP